MSVRRAGSAAAWRGLTYSRPRRASEARRGERWHFQPRSAGSLSSSMCAHAPLPHSISPPSPPPPPPMHRAWGFLWRLAGELWQSTTPFQPPSRLWSEIQVCLILKTAPSLSRIWRFTSQYFSFQCYMFVKIRTPLYKKHTYNGVLMIYKISLYVHSDMRSVHCVIIIGGGGGGGGSEGGGGKKHKKHGPEYTPVFNHSGFEIPPRMLTQT